jgi:hypothetical protein
MRLRRERMRVRRTCRVRRERNDASGEVKGKLTFVSKPILVVRRSLGSIVHRP